MNGRRRAAYAAAVALPAATLLLRTLLPASFGERPLLMLFVPALLTACLIGGLGPGLVATFTTAVLTALFLIPPVGHLWITAGYDQLQWAMLLVSGVMASFMAEHQRRSKAQLEVALAEQRRHDEESQAQRRRLADILAGTRAGTWEWNVQTGEADFNERWAELVGYTRAELSPPSVETWKRLAHPDDLVRSNALLERHFAGELDYYECEVRMKHRDGHWVWVLDRGKVASRTADGKPLMVSGTHQDITQRKLAEESLEHVRSSLEEAQKIAHLGSFEFLAATGTTVWSAEEHRIYGLDPSGASPEYEDMLAKCFPPEDARLVDETFRRALRDNAIYELEHRVLRPDGTVRFVYDRAQPYFDAQGKLLRYVGITLDITDRKAAEDELERYRTRLEELVRERTLALEESNRKLSATQFAMDRAGIGIHWVDAATGRLRYVNDYAANMLGYSVAEMLTFGVADIAPEFSAADFPEIGARLFASGKAHFEATVRNKDGRPIPVEIIGYRMTLPDSSESPGYITFLSDISARKAADEKLALAQKNLAAAQRLARMGSWRLDLATKDVVWSEELYRMFDADPTQPPPNYATQERIFSPESWATLSAAVAKTLETGEPYELELQTRRGGGRTGWALARGERVCDLSGKAVAMQGIAVDITAQKEAEQQLRAAKHQAEVATIAKSTFLANMSHEIRTPLNAITGMAHLLRRSGLTPAQLDKLEKIEAGGNHLLEILNAVLDLSKIEAGKFELEDVPLDVGALFGNIAAILGQKAKDKGLAFCIESPRFSHPLRGDATRVQQALLNLAANAIKFTERGHVTLRAREDASSAETVTVRFEVEDSGVGIAPDVVPRLFGEFEQADNSTTRKYGGTGLGLAITKKLAALMGGAAGVSSIEGQGSTFWFTALLRKAEHAPRGDVGVEPANAEHALRRDHAGKRVLLAEDEPINQELGRVLLEEVGLRVELAGDGREAILKAQSGPYDLILMDMQMPHVDGLEATRQIRRLPSYAKVPILAMTASAFVEDKAHCFQAGMDDFITKPVLPESMFSTLLRWLATGRR